MLEVVTMFLVLANAIVAGVAIGVYLNSKRDLAKLQSITERFEATAKAAAEAQKSQAQRIVDLSDRVNTLAAGRVRSA